MKKEEEVMDFLKQNVFDPILSSPKSSNELKQGVNLTIMRMKKLNAISMVKYYWSAIVGTDNSTKFAKQMKKEGFTRFEEVIDKFRDKFNDAWLRKKDK
jgi:predicted glycosyl hydrolase (DUF1957 family)